jgi:hypothetical protein
MPNWCNNFIRIKHDDPAKIDAIMATEGTEKGVLDTIIPCPAELNDPELTTWAKDQEDRLEAKKRAMKAKYGYESWYDWNIAHWGTKWDLCEPQLTRVDANTVEISCDTAWSPPIAAYETMTEAGYYVEAMYYEGGMCYAGRWDSESGDDCYSDWGDSQGAKATLPQEVDDMFCISESQAEYEEEERLEEELYAFVKEGEEKRKEMKLVDNLDD